MKRSAFILIIGILALAAASLQARTPASAAQGGKQILSTPTAPTGTDPTPTPTGGEPPASIPDTNHANANCLMCHADPNFLGHTNNGDQVVLSVDPKIYYRSAHAQAGLECAACHADQRGYPHTDTQQVACLDCHTSFGGAAFNPQYKTLDVTLNFDNARTLTLKLNEGCKTCHVDQSSQGADSVHTKVRMEGNAFAPVCTDCHGSHDISSPDVPRTKISQTCSKCHLSVYTTYESSVHGTALTDGNPDVPTCVDCHGVHNVQGPSNPRFRDNMIAVCGSCHADPKRMGKYNISTDVFNTYLDDFHGRTVNFFRTQAPMQQSNKATCIDCHGVHNILPPNNPQSTVYPDNLQHTCQQCHPDASIRFPQAWLGHYVPAWNKTPVLFAVNQGYQAFIPATIGGFVIYIALDAQRRIRKKLGSARKPK
jgi:hypothetical protein